MGYESKLPIEGAALYRRQSGPLDRPETMGAFFEQLRTEIDDPSNTELFSRLADPEVVERCVGVHRAEPGWAPLCAAIVCSLESTTHWGNKLLRVELVPTLRELWPDAAFLVLTRDPRGVMASQSKKFEHSVEYSAIYWNTHAEFVRDRLGLLPGQHDHSTMVVDLVEMARDPAPALRWAFAAVGLDTDPVDELVERFPGDPDRLDAWRRSLDRSLQRRVEEYCFDAMRSLGYEPELATAPRSIGRVRTVVAMAREHGGELLRDPGSIRRKQVGRRVRAALDPRR